MCVGVGTMIICGVQRTYLCRHEYHGHVWSSEDKLVSTFSGLSFFKVLFLKVCMCVCTYMCRGSGPIEKVWSLWVKESDT